MIDIPYGSCISWRIPPARNGFIEKIFGYLQNFFTGYPETHCSKTMSKYPEIDAYYEYEQSTTARINVYNGNPNSTVFDILAEEETKVRVLENMIRENYGNVYGIAQTSVFGVRWLFEKLHIGWWNFGKQLPNPLGFLSICSKEGYLYLYGVGLGEGWHDLVAYLGQGSADAFHSGDFREVLDWMVERNYAVKIIGE